jgi:hypothetical protein
VDLDQSLEHFLQHRFQTLRNLKDSMRPRFLFKWTNSMRPRFFNGLIQCGQGFLMDQFNVAKVF